MGHVKTYHPPRPVPAIEKGDSLGEKRILDML